MLLADKVDAFTLWLAIFLKNKQVSNAKQLQKKCFIVNELLLYKINNVYLQNNTTIILYSMCRKRQNDEKQLIR